MSLLQNDVTFYEREKRQMHGKNFIYQRSFKLPQSGVCNFIFMLTPQVPIWDSYLVHFFYPPENTWRLEK